MLQRVKTGRVVLGVARGVWPGKWLGQAFGAVAALLGVVRRAVPRRAESLTKINVTVSNLLCTVTRHRMARHRSFCEKYG